MNSLSKTKPKKTARRQRVKSDKSQNFQTRLSLRTYRLSPLDVGGLPAELKWHYLVQDRYEAIPLSASQSSGVKFAFNYPEDRVSLGWPLLSGAYQGFCVTASHMRVLFTNKSTSVSYRVAVTPYNEATNISIPPTNDNILISSPFSKQSLLGPVAGNAGSIHVDNRVDVHRLFGLPQKVSPVVDDYCGDIGGANTSFSYAAPIIKGSWAVTCSTTDGTTVPANTVYVAVSILYDVTFYDKLPVF